MGNPLRQRLTATKFASVGQVIEISEEVSSFDSLSEIVEADLAALEADKIPPAWRESVVRGELQFGFVAAAGNVPTMSGQVRVELDAVCQRCLEPFRQRLEIEPRLLLLNAHESVAEFDDYEIWELDEDTLRPLDIVEELLIMAMPFSAMHDNMADCKAFSAAIENVTEIRRPFAALAAQMKQVEKDPDV
ncbi:MAG TPA: YceD family protein [Woeseiaceae bacterium]|nr:YceD family protein [Woeseiaceae bacterium]